MEIIATLVIIAIMAAVAVPAMSGYIEDARKKSYLSEAYMVRAAVQSYIMEKNAEGTFSEYDMYEDIIIPPIRDKDNALNRLLEGSCAEDAQILGVAYSAQLKDVTNFVYGIKKYEIEIKDDSIVEFKERK